MGASQSSNSIDVINKSCIDVITSNLNQCSSSITAVQDNTVGGVDLFGRNVQTVSIDQKCTQNLVIDNNMIAQMANKIQQEASAGATTLLPGYAGSFNNQTLQNYLSSKITTQNVQQALASINATQINVVLPGGTSVGKVNVQQLTTVQTALQTLLNNNKVAQDLTTDTNQSGSATTDTNFIAGIFSAITGTIWTYIIVLILLIVIVMVIIVIYRRATRDDPQIVAMPPDQVPQPGQETGPMVDEEGYLVNETGQRVLDANSQPIRLSDAGTEIDAAGQPVLYQGRPVYVDRFGARTLDDGSKVPVQTQVQAQGQVGMLASVPPMAMGPTPGGP